MALECSVQDLVGVVIEGRLEADFPLSFELAMNGPQKVVWVGAGVGGQNVLGDPAVAGHLVWKMGVSEVV